MAYGNLLLVGIFDENEISGDECACVFEGKFD